jgi:AcrR family transcriptional regulator
MTSNRRIGTEDSQTRSLLLDRAETLMRDEGYAAVTSRQLGKAAGLSPQIVYYYFRTMDDLFDALFERIATYYLSEVEKARASDAPLISLWNLSSDPSRAALVSEFVALANHRKGLKSIIASFGREYHARQAAIIADYFAEKGIDQTRWSATTVAIILENLARGVSLSVDFEIGNIEETRRFIVDRLVAFVDAAGDTSGDRARPSVRAGTRRPPRSQPLSRRDRSRSS